MNAPTDDVTSRLELALSAAREAGTLTLNYFQQPDLAVDRKADDSPVTVADREAEQLLRRRIGAAFPDDAILGEEYPDEPGTSGWRWILDPIDGTKSFVSGVPLYGTLVGVERERQSLVGVIFIPGLDECVYAARGLGAWYVKGQSQPRRAQVSVSERLSDQLLVTTEMDGFVERGAVGAFETLRTAAWLTRTWGDCYGYLLVATGRAAVMIDPAMNVWDAAAIQPIMEEAGGTFTDWQGEPTIYGGEGIATNGKVLQQVLDVTRAFSKP